MNSALAREIAINFERICVMEQRQFITMRLDRQGTVPGELMDYAVAVDAFNAAFDDHISFEKFYTSSLDHKTRDNALVLDKKHEALKEKFLHVRRVLLRIRT